MDINEKQYAALYEEMEAEERLKQRTIDDTYLRLRILSAMATMDSHVPGFIIEILDQIWIGMADIVTPDVQRVARDVTTRIYHDEVMQ